MRQGPPANKLPEHLRRVTKGKAFNFISKIYPDITREEFDSAIEIGLIPIKTTKYTYNKGKYLSRKRKDKDGKAKEKRTDRIVTQRHRTVLISDVKSWAETRNKDEAPYSS